MLESRRSNGSGKTIPIFRLSAQMVDLSLQHDQRDSLLTHSPTHSPIKSECYPPEPKVQPITVSFASTTQEEATKEALLDRNTETHSGLVRASRRLLQISVSRISGHRVRIYDSRLWTSIGIVAITLLAFGAVYGLRGHHPDSVKSNSQILPAVQQHQKLLAPATNIASKSTHTGAHAAAASRSKSRARRRQGDYIAKDTTVYYGKDGKPSH
jgi:hypothetical protein